MSLVSGHAKYFRNPYGSLLYTDDVQNVIISRRRRTSRRRSNVRYHIYFKYGFAAQQTGYNCRLYTEFYTSRDLRGNDRIRNTYNYRLFNKCVFIGYVALQQAAHIDDPIIYTEIVLCIKWLVEKHGEKLQDAVWDRVFAIIKLLVDGFGTYAK